MQKKQSVQITFPCPKLISRIRTSIKRLFEAVTIGRMQQHKGIGVGLHRLQGCYRIQVGRGLRSGPPYRKVKYSGGARTLCPPLHSLPLWLGQMSNAVLPLKSLKNTWERIHAQRSLAPKFWVSLTLITLRGVLNALFLEPPHTLDPTNNKNKQ